MSNRLVMIVDDEKGLLQLFSMIIRRLGYEVIEIDNGQRAIEQLQHITPDLLVLDLAMPQVNGRDVLAFIKGTPELNSMPIMVLTALGHASGASDELSRATRWVSKPVRPDDFVKHFQDMLAENS